MRKVLLATPALDGRLDVWYTNSVINSVRICQAEGIYLHPVFLSFDALIQRARNDLFRLAIEEGYDEMIFVDSDLEFDPQWILDLLNAPEDVIGGTYRKKTDEKEIYVVKTKNLETSDNGLIKVEGLGTGFVKFSRKALEALWEDSPKYQNEGRECRMVCNVEVINGDLVSEDIVIFRKLDKLGFTTWLNPNMTCNHTGTKKFQGNFASYAKRMKGQAVSPV
jgi:hypothetical protein